MQHRTAEQGAQRPKLATRPFIILNKNRRNSQTRPRDGQLLLATCAQSFQLKRDVCPKGTPPCVGAKELFFMTTCPAEKISPPQNPSSCISPLLRLPQVLSLMGVSQSCWYAGMRRGDYPSPVRIGRRAVAWRLADLKPLLDHGLDGGQDDAD